MKRTQSREMPKRWMRRNIAAEPEAMRSPSTLPHKGEGRIAEKKGMAGRDLGSQGAQRRKDSCKCRWSAPPRIDSGNLVGDIVSEEFACWVGMSGEPCRRKVETAATVRMLLIVRQCKPVSLKITGIETEFEIHPWVARGMKNPINLGRHLFPGVSDVFGLSRVVMQKVADCIC